MADDMTKLVGFSISLLILVVVFYLGPGIGEEISTALPVCSTGDFADVTTGAEVWDAGTGLTVVVVIILLVGLGLGALYKLKND